MKLVTIENVSLLYKELQVLGIHTYVRITNLVATRVPMSEYSVASTRVASSVRTPTRVLEYFEYSTPRERYSATRVLGVLEYNSTVDI
jgi:hypothetical protein